MLNDNDESFILIRKKNIENGLCFELMINQIIILISKELYFCKEIVR